MENNKIDNELNKLFLLIQKLGDEDLTFEKCTELIYNNYEIKNLLSVIVDENKNIIYNYGAEILTDNKNIISLIDAFCILNKREDMSEDYDTLCNDNIKAYLNNLGEGNCSILSPEMERELAIKISNGDKNAYKSLVTHNLRLVYNIAKGYLGRGLPLDDIIGEGNLGLMIAAKRFDYTKGYKFSTYATWWIKRFIIDAVTLNRNIKLPMKFAELVKKYKYCYNDLVIQLGRTPKIEEIADKLNITIEKVLELQKNQNDTISLNSLVDSEIDNFELNDLVPANENVEDIVDRRLDKEILYRAIESLNLPSNKLAVLIMRYGLNGDKPATFEKIANSLGVSYQRIQEIEKEVLNKLYDVLNSNSIKNNSTSISISKKSSIYEDFKDYTEEQIDKMKSQLSSIERTILNIKYGIELGSWTEELNLEYESSILPKILDILNKLKMADNAKNINLSEFLTDKILKKIIYGSEPYTKYEELCFKTLITDIRIQKILYYFPDIYSQILKLRLGIDNSKCLSITELSEKFVLDKFEVSNILSSIFDKYKSDIPFENIKSTKKRC